MYDMKGKVAMVTGTSRKKGIGRVIALRLAQEGADMVVTDQYIPPELYPEWEKQEGWKGLDSLVEEIEALGRQALAVTTSINVKEEVEQMVAKAIDRFGHIDILVNNAALHSHSSVPGVLDSYPLLEMTEDVWNRYLGVNIGGALLVSQAVVKHMKERGQGGKIINISSRAGKRASRNGAHYSVSKRGLIGLSEVMALEWAPYKINVNVVCPGSVPTMAVEGRGKVILESMHDEGLTEEEAIARMYQSSLERIPLGRLGSPEDISNMVAFLASNQSDYITGETISVNGGSLLG